MKQVAFPESPTGKTEMFDEPIFQSVCGRWRISVLDCVRPFRLFRKINSKGWPWIGVGSGFDSREDAEAAANNWRKSL